LSILLAVVGTNVVLGQGSIEYDPSTGAITADSSDFVLTGSADEESVSLKALSSAFNAQSIAIALLTEQVQNLTAREPGPTADDVTASIDAAVAGAVRSLLTGDNSLTKSVATLQARLDEVDNVLAGLPQTRKAVSDIASDVAYLLTHSANVTRCAADGDVHVGDGTCVNPIPQCEAPNPPRGGNVTLSSKFIIPGVTAEYTCEGALAFVAGPSVRSCVEETLQFDGSPPACKECEVSNCVRCVNDVDTCAECAYGHDLTADSKSCPERADTIVMMEHRSAQSLSAKATSWERFYPNPPTQTEKGALSLMRGAMYLVGHGGHGSCFGFYKLEKGASTWSTFPEIVGTTQFGSTWIGRVENPVFYATVNGVGNSEDGFYIFYLTGSAVYQPAVDTTKWRPLPVHGNGDAKNIRSNGATAVVGKSIYLLGGMAKSAARDRTYSNLVDVFDTSTRRWSASTPMTAGRIGHAAASYDGKVFVFGGRSVSNVPQALVEMFDPATKKWTARTPMPEAWEYMSTGPMPVFASGTVLIPYAFKPSTTTGIVASLEYDTKNDEWKEGPAPVLKKGKYVVVQGALE